jgi:hypothetical protein
MYKVSEDVTNDYLTEVISTNIQEVFDKYKLDVEHVGHKVGYVHYDYIADIQSIKIKYKIKR